MDGPLIPETPGMARPYVIVIGNEKGGTGKSTTATHLIVALLRLGFSVGSVDLDARQRTLTRVFDNRRAYAEAGGCDLPMPEHHHIARSNAPTRAKSES